MAKTQSNKKKQKKTKMRNNKKKRNYTYKKMKGGEPNVKVIAKIFPSENANSKGYNIGNITFSIVGANKIFSNYDQVDHFLDNLYTYVKRVNNDPDVLKKVFRYTGDKIDEDEQKNIFGNKLELIITPQLNPDEAKKGDTDNADVRKKIIEKAINDSNK